MNTTTTTTGWNASEGIMDERLSSIAKLKKISQIFVVPSPKKNGRYVLKYIGEGNQFSGFPSVLGTTEYDLADAGTARLIQLSGRGSMI